MLFQGYYNKAVLILILILMLTSPEAAAVNQPTASLVELGKLCD